MTNNNKFKKIVLKKETVSNLNDHQMNSIVGGKESWENCSMVGCTADCGNTSSYIGRCEQYSCDMCDGYTWGYACSASCYAC